MAASGVGMCSILAFCIWFLGFSSILPSVHSVFSVLWYMLPYMFFHNSYCIIIETTLIQVRMFVFDGCVVLLHVVSGIFWVGLSLSLPLFS